MTDEAAKSKLRELRTSAGISRSKLAKMLELSPGTILNYENGATTPDEATIGKLADIFHVGVDVLSGDAAVVSDGNAEEVRSTNPMVDDQGDIELTPDEIANSQMAEGEEDEPDDDDIPETRTVTLDLHNAPPVDEEDDPESYAPLMITLDPVRAIRERDWISNLDFGVPEDAQVLKVDGIIDSAGNTFDGSTIDDGEQMLVRTTPPKGMEGGVVSALPELAIRNEFWVQPLLSVIGGKYYAIVMCHSQSIDLTKGMPFALIK